MTFILELRRQVDSLQAELSDKKKRLEEYERQCCHQWGDIVYDPIVTPGYTVPEFRRGSDYQGRTDVPPKTTRRWKRMCSLCGKTEFTQHVIIRNIAGEIAGTKNEIEVPIFR